MKTPPRVYINMQLCSKNLPEEYRGIVRENWNIGKKFHVTLAELIICSTVQIIKFYTLCMPDTKKEIYDQIKIAIRELEIIKNEMGVIK